MKIIFKNPLIIFVLIFLLINCSNENSTPITEEGSGVEEDGEDAEGGPGPNEGSVPITETTPVPPKRGKFGDDEESAGAEIDPRGEPKSPISVSEFFSKTLDLRLRDKEIIWRKVGLGKYDISIKRVIDNALVFNVSIEDTFISYTSLGLPESIRYTLKIQHSTKGLPETKSFSLISGGNLLNPTCKD